MLPIYTVLVPLYQEQAALPGLLNSLRNIDYPKSKLDIKLLVEADDDKTVKALKALKPESYFDIIEIPPSQPRTKPKALNYGIRFAHGSLVAVYDAEDQPDPLQLRKSASYFGTPHGKTVCLQARLNYYNRDKNMLTRLFSLEYAAWFDHMLRGLEYLKMPIPLGGTSNHIELSTLEKLGLWDPFNVTEDADLGMRIYSHGGSCGLLDSTTMEEAPSTISVWLCQRTRWIKGYMQTYIVCMRSPLKRIRRCGWKDFIGIQLFIGGPVAVFVLSPFLWLGAGLWWL
jgi:cellulose synthase/poly-beta-1,6-N-acetylglucosamine synthase-like glycosyltransferase